MSLKLDRLLVRTAMASRLALAAAPVLAPALVFTPAALMLAKPASAQNAPSTTRNMKLVKITVTGNQQVSTAAIDAAMTVKIGQKVSKADLVDNLNAIVDVYRKANVGGGFKQKMTVTGGTLVSVTYMIEEKAALPPQAPAVLTVDKVTFEGNKRVKSDAIQAAITLKPGEAVDETKVAANMQAIMALYKKGGIGVQITPSATYPQPNHAIVDYQIVEKAAE